MEASARELVVLVVREHAESLLRVARRHTVCAADAEDAYQRALEIFVKNAHRLDAEGAHKWLHVVVRNEALAVRRSRSSLVGVEDEAALDALDDARHVASVEERSERVEDLGRAAEALQRLKPQEVTALWLKAEGLSYDEIAERQGWTYTKVNRCITEGRRAFLRRYAGIQAGEECERWTDVLSAIADGEATQQQLLDARPHLRNCPACRSALAAMRDSGRAVAALLPVGALAGHATSGAGETAPVAEQAAAVAGDTASVAGDATSAAAGAANLHDRAAAAVAGLHDRAAAAVTSLHERAAALAASLHERAAGVALKAQAAVDAAASGKLAAVAASAAAVAGGGVAAERHFGEDAARAAPSAPAAVRADPAPAEEPQAATSGASRPAAAGAAAGAASARAAAGADAAKDRRPGAAAFALETTEGSDGGGSPPPRSEPAARAVGRLPSPGEPAAGAGGARSPGAEARRSPPESGGEFGFVPARE